MLARNRWEEIQEEFYGRLDHIRLQYSPRSTYARNLVGEALARTKLTAGDKVLEVGSGSGRFTGHLANAGFFVTALDSSEKMLDALEKTASLTPTLGSVYDAASLLEHRQFDAVFGFFILHHLDDMKRALTSLRAVLRDGGEAVFIEPNRLNPLFLVQILACRDMHWAAEKGTYRYGTSGYQRCFEDCGFQVEIIKFGFFPPQILDRWPWLLAVEKMFEKTPLVRDFLPFLSIRGTKAL